MPLGLHTAELNFETIEEIGQEGKNSEVYLAHDRQLDAEIVVKKIAKTRIKDSSSYYAESKKLYASSHQNVVQVNYGCEDEDNIYIAMPYYKNGSLKQYVQNNNLSIREIIRYSIQFLSGLHHIHSKGLIHFDVKPDNILISDNNEALLSDFGLSKAMDELGFANPEQIYQKQVPPENFTQANKTYHYDIYLAGMTLYRLLVGESSFNYQLSRFKSMDDYKEAILNGSFPNPAAFPLHIPIKLQRTINKALHVNPERRQQNVLNLINELNEIEENLDWVFTEKENLHNWIKLDEKYTYEVNVNLENSKKISIKTTKTNNRSGSTRRIRKHCHNNLTKSNVVSNIKRALKL